MSNVYLKKIIKENLIIENFKQKMQNNPNYVNFDKLTHSKKMVASYFYLLEVNSMLKNETITEQFDLNSIVNFISGNKTASAGASGIGQYFLERMIKSLATRIGIKESWLLDTIVNYFLDNPLDIIKSFTDCNLMTEKILDALVETLVKKLVDGNSNFLGTNILSSGLGGVLRNSIMELFQNAEWKKTLVSQFTPIVCKFVSEFTSKIASSSSNFFTSFLK